MAQKQITFYGAKFCAPCNDLRDRMTREQISFKYIDVDEVRGAHRQMLEAARGKYLLPTLVIGGKEVLLNPTIDKVRKAAGV